MNEANAHDRPSEDMKSLLLAYTLCKNAIDSHEVLKEQITAAIFQTAITSYYSIFKLRRKEKEKKKKSIFAPKHDTRMRLDIDLHMPQGRSLAEHLELIFLKYERRRDRNIVHRDKKREKEKGALWLRIPDGVGGSPRTPKGTLYLWGLAFVQPTLSDMNEFCALIRITIDILWQKEEMAPIRIQSTSPSHSQPLT